MISEKKRFGLIGYPLGHSISPQIHSELFKLSGVVGEYGLFEIEKEKLESSFENGLKKLDGFNVTIPYKTEIIPLLDRLSPRAGIFGNVNTVFFEDGKAVGYNTDCIGFLRALSYAGIEIKGDVLVIGCGGVARTFVTECILAEANVTVAIRPSSEKKAEAFRADTKKRLNKDIEIKLLSEIDRGYDLIINATPVGMYPNVSDCPIGEDVIKSSAAVFDAIYNPLETELLRLAKKHGVKCSNGLSMLVWQAAVAEEIWNDVEFEKDDIAYVIKCAEEYLKNE